MTLLAGGVLPGDDPQPGAQLPRMAEASEVADLAISPSAVRVEMPLNRVRISTTDAHRSSVFDDGGCT